MAHFFAVSPRFWDDEKVAAWTDAQQKLALYLLTCKHRNLEGLYVLPLSYAAEDCNWSVTKTRRNMTELCKAGFCEYDETSKVVLIAKALDYYQPKSEKQLKGALNDLSSIPETGLQARFLAEAEHRAPDLYKALSNGTEL